MKKILAILLAFLMLLPCLVACKKDELSGNPEGSDSESIVDAGDAETEDSSAEEEPRVLDLVKNGETAFTIVYPQGASEVISGAALSLRSSLQNKTGVIFKVQDDFLRTGETASTETFEILVGMTNRSESQTELADLVGYNDYAVKVSGNKLVIIGKNDDAISNAVFYLINKVLSKMEDVTMGTQDLSFSEEQNYLYKAVYPLASMKLFGTAIGDFKIVIPADGGMTETRFAAQLAIFLNTMTGAQLDVIRDTESSGKNEIYVGKTSKTSASVSKYEYAVAAKNGNLELMADSIYGFEAMQTYTQTMLSNGILKAADKADSGEVVKTSVSADIDHVINKAGDYRIMYHNVWGWNESATNPTEQRNEMMVDTYVEYNPDILCLQEVTHQMRLNKTVPLLEEIEKYGYAEVEHDPINNLYTATPILYKTDMFKVVEKGLTKFEYGGGQDKFITWAVFETLDENGNGTGTKLGVISVHLAYQSGETGEAYRMDQVPRVVEIAKAIYAEHTCPVITGGDMNCKMESKPYNKYLELGFTDIWTAMGESDMRDDDATNFGYPTWNVTAGIFERKSSLGGEFKNSIDHVFFYGDGLTFKRYKIVQDNYVMCASDHTPTVIDFNLAEFTPLDYTNSEYTKNY